MFSQSVRRAARSAPCLASSSSACAKTTIVALGTSSQHRPHQRRLSSSKASCPPGGPRGPEQPANSTAVTSSEEEKPNKGVSARRKSRDAAVATATKARDDAFAKLPAVPPTTNLQPSDVAVSTFFSLHRPISLTKPVPATCSTSTFNSIFDARPSQHRPNDVIYTISSAVSTLEGSSQSNEEKDLRWEIIQQSEASQDQMPTLEQLVKQFRPFNVPPAPVPFDEAAAAAEEMKMLNAERQYETSDQLEPTHKTFTTTLTISESTATDGSKTYTASATPIIERDQEATETTETEGLDGVAVEFEADAPLRQPFATRLRERVGAQASLAREKGEALMISVKRQRKLKMKKHKYKKLMKRTRNLRRREGRT